MNFLKDYFRGLLKSLKVSSNQYKMGSQECVWDYPRPPRLEKSSNRIRVVFGGTVVADSTEAYRTLETSHPPVYYIPPSDVQTQYLTPTQRQTFCEFKGPAKYFNLKVGDKQAPNSVWCYPNPVESYSSITNYFAFYPRMMDACYVGDEQVQSQEGDFYGGWITSNIVGPFKGGPGTWGW